MATTIGHSALAVTVAQATNETEIPIRILALILLTLSHGPMDAIPHPHFYNYTALKAHFTTKNALGAAFELGGGFIVLPLLVWHFCGINPVWLYACVFAASLFDFLVATGYSAFDRLNKWFHWWEDDEEKINLMAKIVCEVEILAIIAIFFFHLY